MKIYKNMGKCIGILLLLASLVNFVYADPTYINTLPYTINQSGEYVLNTSCTDLGSTAITINTSNVVLNGNKNVLDGAKAYNTYGIYIGNHKNITIKNLTVKEFYYGIGIRYSYNNSIMNANVFNNSHGIYLEYSYNNTITNTTVCDNKDDGICLDGYSYNNTITNTTVYDNGNGICLDDYSYNNTITNTTVCDNVDGICLDDYSYNNTITNTTVCDNVDGICLDYYSSNNTITNTTVCDNKDDGICLDEYSYNNTITNTTVCDNRYNGIYLDYSSNNTITNAIVCDNGYGIYLNYYSSNNNILNNTFKNCGLFIKDGSSNNNNNIENNTVNGKPLIYLKNEQNIILDNSNIGQVIAINCKNISVKNVELNNASVGIEYYGVNDSIITNTTVCDNTYGIYMHSSSYNNISNVNSSNSATGIYLDSSSNNIIVNTTVCNNNYYGIYLFSSSYNNISNVNSSNNSDTGINLDSSSNNTITNATVYDNRYDGIYLDSSSNNTITNAIVCDNRYDGICLDDSSSNNTITNAIVCDNRYDGIYLNYYSSNNNILNNTFKNCGLFVKYFQYSNTVKNNTVNGKPLIYLENEQNIILDNSNIGQVIAINCKNISVKNVELNNASVGIEYYGVNDSIITNTTVCNNTYGIYMHSSSYNNISNVNSSNSATGIYLDSSSNNIIVNTTVCNNNYGIYLYYSSNNIYLNNLINNTENIGIGSSSYNSIFHSPEKISYKYDGKNYTNYLGNYYSNYDGSDSNNDGIGDTPYIIDSNNNDTYPLIKEYYVYVDTTAPTVSINTPENKSYLIGTVQQINTTVIDNYKVDSVIAEIHYSNGTITNISLSNVNGTNDYVNTSEIKYSVGTNTIVILANDTSGNLNNTENVSFKVIDNESPTVEINSPINTSYLLGNVSKINATVKDNYKVDSVIAEIHYANGTITNMTLSNVNGTNDYVNTTTLNFSTLGSYLIKIYANDTSGNLNNTENVSFKVIDNESPTVVINTPENTSYLVYHTPKINTTVKDNYKVDTVIAEIHYANGTVENITLSNVNGTNDYVNTSEINISTLGNYLIKIYANDTSGNLNNSENISFTVIDNITPTVNITSPVENKSYLIGTVPQINTTVKDNICVDSVIAEIHYANGTIENITLSNVNGTNDYTNTTTLNYPVGTNTIVMLANDTSGNLNNTENVSFKIYKNTVYYHSDNNHHNSYSYPEVSSDIKVYRMREHIHSSNVIAGSSVDDNYAKELKTTAELTNKPIKLDKDTILVGGPVSNQLTKTYIDKFPVKISNNYPGDSIGVIQVITLKHVEVENNIYRDIKVVLLAGSDRYGTKAAVEYFKTLNDIPDEPVYVQWKDGKAVKIEKP